MAQVTVQFYAALRIRLNTPGIEVEGATLEQALASLRSRIQPETGSALFDENGFVKSHFRVALNMRVVDCRKDHKTPVNEGDTIHVFPPAIGG